VWSSLTLLPLLTLSPLGLYGRLRCSFSVRGAGGGTIGRVFMLPLDDTVMSWPLLCMVDWIPPVSRESERQRPAGHGDPALSMKGCRVSSAPVKVRGWWVLWCAG